MSLLTLLQGDFGAIDRTIRQVGIDSYLRTVLSKSPSAYYRLGDLPPVPSDSTTLRWRPPTLVSPSVVPVNPTGFFSATFADDEDVILVFPGSYLQSPMSIIGGRNIQVIGGGMRPTAGTVGGAGSLMMRFQELSGSLYLEGVNIDANNFAVSALTAGGSAEQVDESLWFKFPDLFIQNSRLVNVKTHRALQFQYPVGRLYMDKVTVSSSGFGLFIPPGKPIEAAYLSRINIEALSGGLTDPYPLWVLDTDDSNPNGPRGLVPYPVYLDDVWATMLAGGGHTLAANLAWPAAGHLARGLPVGLSINADNTQASWPSTMKTAGVLDVGPRADGDIVDEVDIGPGYSTAGQYSQIDLDAVVGPSGSYALTSRHVFDVAGSLFEADVSGAHQFGAVKEIDQTAAPVGDIPSREVMGVPRVIQGTPLVVGAGAIASKQAVGATVAVGQGAAPGVKSYITRTGKEMMYKGSVLRLKGNHSHHEGSHGSYNYGNTVGSTQHYVRSVADFEAMSDLGMNHCRWSFSYGDWHDPTMRANLWAKLDQALASAKASNMWLVPMCFTYPTDWYTTSPPTRSYPAGSPNAPDGYDGYSSCGFPAFYNTLATGAGGAGNVYQDMHCNMWKDIALRYKDEEGIAMWDLFNEPIAPSQGGGNNWWRYMGYLHDQIRAVDPNHLVSIPYMLYFPKTPQQAGISNFTTLHPNVVYQVHDYEPLSITHQDPPVGRAYVDSGAVANGYNSAYFFIHPHKSGPTAGLGSTPGSWKVTIRANAGNPANKDFLLYDSANTVLEQYLNIAGGTMTNIAAAINAASTRIFAQLMGNGAFVLENKTLDTLGDNPSTQANLAGTFPGSFTSWYGTFNLQAPADFQALFAAKESDFIAHQNSQNIPIYVGEWGLGGCNDSRHPHGGVAQRQSRKASYYPMFARALDNMGWSWAAFEWRHYQEFETQLTQGAPRGTGFYRNMTSDQWALNGDPPRTWQTATNAETPLLTAMKPVLTGTRKAVWAGTVPPPTVVITSPTQGLSTADTTPPIQGTCQGNTGDGAVGLGIYAGSTITGTLVTLVTAPRTGTNWGPVDIVMGGGGGLAPGTYTVRAQQTAADGQTGYSNPVTFTITAPTQTGTVLDDPAWVPYSTT